MPLINFTVPEEGKSKKVQTKGLSVYVVKAPNYEDALAAPRLSFNNAGSQYPCLLGSIIGSDIGTFSNLVITGTAESAGDEITLLGIPICLETNLNLPDTGIASAVTIGATISVNSTNNPQQLSDLQLADADGNLPRSILIQAKNNQIAYKFDSDPDQNGDGYVLAPPNNANGRNGSLIEFNGWDRISKLRFISAAADTHGTLLITPEY